MTPNELGVMNDRVDRVNMYRPDVYLDDGSVNAPKCCNQKMTDIGTCSDGCCDIWECSVCGKRIRTEAPD